MSQLPDVCRIRHGGTATSEEANARVHNSKANQQQTILFLLEARGTLTLHDAAEYMRVDKNQISGRFTELKNAGVIERNGDRRDGCFVWVMKPKLVTNSEGQGLMFGGARP